MKPTKKIIVYFLPLLLVFLNSYGCAHKISISPNVSMLSPRHGADKIPGNVGYIFPPNSLNKEVVKSASGGDSIKFFPYKDLEAAYAMMLRGVFQRVTPLISIQDPKITENAVDYLATLDISTASRSEASMLWPPTWFRVDLTLTINKPQGENIAVISVKGKGRASPFERDSNRGLAGKRAVVEALDKMQKALLYSEELNKNSVRDSNGGQSNGKAVSNRCTRRQQVAQAKKITLAPSLKTKEEFPAKESAQMRFILPEGGKNSENLQKTIKICAKENSIDFDLSQDSLDPKLGKAQALDTVEEILRALEKLRLVFGVATAPVAMLRGDYLSDAAYVLSSSGMTPMNHCENKILQYSFMQRCMEQRGYICEGFCPDRQSEGFCPDTVSIDNSLSECLDTSTSMDQDDCYEKEKERKKLEKSIVLSEPQKIMQQEGCEHRKDAKRAYLAHNVWLSYKDQQYSANFKEGKILPVGTEVINPCYDSYIASAIITFTVKDTCETISVKFMPRFHPGKKVEDYYDRMFSEKNFDELTVGLNPEEIKAIKAGRLIEGMSRTSAIMAYGYPPEFLTPETTCNLWEYLVNGQTTRKLYFDLNGQISNVMSTDPCWNEKTYVAGTVVDVDAGGSFTFECENGIRGDFHLYASFAPELDEHLGEEAKEYFSNIVNHETAYLKVAQQKDGDNYVFLWARDDLVNLEMVRQNYAWTNNLCPKDCLKEEANYAKIVSSTTFLFENAPPCKPVQLSESYMDGLNSEDISERINTIKTIFSDRGIDLRVYSAINDLIEEKYRNDEMTNQEKDELSWLCKALATSGREEYKEILSRVYKTANSFKVKLHAKQSLSLIDTYAAKNEP